MLSIIRTTTIIIGKRCYALAPGTPHGMHDPLINQPIHQLLAHTFNKSTNH